MPTLIHLPRQTGGDRLFFERSPLGVRSLYCEAAEPVLTSSPPTLPKPLSPYPRATFFETYFYSEASLDDVDTIVPCHRLIRGKQRIIGLYLQFPGDQTSCVGQVRLDSLASPLRLSGHQRIWLGFSKEDHRPFVSALTLGEPSPSDKVSWLEVQLRGKLVWWFSMNQCQVCYGEESSPPTRL